MSRVSTYLNFMGNSEEAFEFYRGVFGTDYLSPTVRYSDVPSDPDGPALSERERNCVMHAEFPILAGHVLMATDMIGSMGHGLRIGNNTTINLEFDDRAEAERVYADLASQATESTELQRMFWGAHWGTCLDQFGVRWMFNFTEA